MVSKKRNTPAPDPRGPDAGAGGSGNVSVGVPRTRRRVTAGPRPEAEPCRFRDRVTISTRVEGLPVETDRLAVRSPAPTVTTAGIDGQQPRMDQPRQRGYGGAHGRSARWRNTSLAAAARGARAPRARAPAAARCSVWFDPALLSQRLRVMRAQLRVIQPVDAPGQHPIPLEGGHRHQCQVSAWRFVGLGFVYPARAAGTPLCYPAPVKRFRVPRPPSLRRSFLCRVSLLRKTGRKPYSWRRQLPRRTNANLIRPRQRPALHSGPF